MQACCWASVLSVAPLSRAAAAAAAVAEDDPLTLLHKGAHTLKSSGCSADATWMFKGNTSMHAALYRQAGLVEM